MTALEVSIDLRTSGDGIRALLRNYEFAESIRALLRNYEFDILREQGVIPKKIGIRNVTHLAKIISPT